jgi:Fis family transcriptional regulator, factor for inversion stimulation protein
MKDGFEGLVAHLLDGGLFLQQAIEILEKSMIQGALQCNQGNQCAAAKQLGIHRNTLQRKMVAYEVGGTRTRVRRKPVTRAGHPPKKKTGAA